MNEELKKAFIQYLQLKSGALTQQEFEAYIQLLGEEGLKKEYAEFMQLMQQLQVLAAKFGAKLDYINHLKGNCPEGFEAKLFRKGGQICKKCVQKAKMLEGGEVPKNPIDAFRCGRKMKKAACGTKVKKDQEGAKVRATKRTTTYPGKLLQLERTVVRYEDGTQAVMNSGWNSNGKWTATYRGRLGEFGNTEGTPRLKAIADSLSKADWYYGGGVPTVRAIRKKLNK